jgi:hypothetical protein
VRDARHQKAVTKTKLPKKKKPERTACGLMRQQEQLLNVAVDENERFPEKKKAIYCCRSQRVVEMSCSFFFFATNKHSMWTKNI